MSFASIARRLPSLARFAPRWPGRSRLHLVYFLLAGFDILTICVTLTVSHSITTTYERGVETTRAWAHRVRAITELEVLVRDTDLPGNDIFTTGDVVREKARADLAIEQFRAKWADISRELRENVSLAERRPIEEHLSVVRVGMESMALESDAIYRDYARGLESSAAAHMSAMDSTYGDLIARIAETINIVQDYELLHLQRQLDTAEVVRQIEIAIIVLVFFIVCAVLIYGHQIGETIRKSEEKNAELVARLNAERTRLEHYADNVSHELRGPVSKMRVGAEVLLGREHTAEEYQEYLLSNIEECDRLGNIVDGLLFLARASNTELSLVRARIDVRRELALLCDYFDAAASRASVTLTLEQDSEIQIEADRTLFQRVISNLISNALAHTPAGGSVTVGARAESGCLRIDVKDTGVGISEEAQAHVFERFYRGKELRENEGGRIGLGMPIAKSIVELHGGTIRLTSSPGKGTTVTVRFPLRAPVSAKMTTA